MIEGFTDFPRPQKQEIPQSVPVEIEGIDEAREFVAELIAQGIRPVITVPEEHVANVMQYGITSVPKHDLLSGKKFSFVAGVIGIDPFLPKDELRHVFEIDPTKVRIEPRLTGSDNAFHGVVGFPDGVPASALTSVDMRKGPLH